jgi:hypothetical protein
MTAVASMIMLDGQVLSLTGSTAIVNGATSALFVVYEPVISGREIFALDAPVMTLLLGLSLLAALASVAVGLPVSKSYLG